jgi:hypothetical protein
MRYAGDDAGLFLPVLCAEYCSLGQRTRGRFVERNMFDILLSLKREDSYGLPLVLRDGFGGFLPQPPYFSGGQRRGCTFGLPAHRSFGQMDFRVTDSEKQEAFYPRPETSRLYGPNGK